MAPCQRSWKVREAPKKLEGSFGLPYQTYAKDAVPRLWRHVATRKDAEAAHGGLRCPRGKAIALPCAVPVARPPLRPRGLMTVNINKQYI